MTPPTPAALPQWPEKPSADDCAVYGQHAFTYFHRANYLAAMARLRLAVEALRKISKRDGIDGYPDDAWCVVATEALAAIGEVPPSSPLPAEVG